MRSRRPLDPATLRPGEGPGDGEQPGLQALLDAVDEMFESGEFDWAEGLRDLYDGIREQRRWTRGQLQAINNIRSAAGYRREPWPELREEDLVR